MRAGRLRDAAEFIRRKPGQDHLGQEKDEWEVFLRRRVELKYLSGAESDKPSGEISRVKFEVRMRYDNDAAQLKPSHRMVVNQVRYDIQSVAPPNNRRRTLVLIVEQDNAT